MKLHFSGSMMMGILFFDSSNPFDHLDEENRLVFEDGCEKVGAPPFEMEDIFLDKIPIHSDSINPMNFSVLLFTFFR